jgi:hypothetical protein
MSPNVKKVRRAKVKTLRRQRVKTFKRTTQQHRLRPQTTSRTTYPLLRLLGEHQSQNYEQRERGNKSDQRGSTFLLLTLPLNIGRVVRGKQSGGKFVGLKKASQIGVPKNMWTLGYLVYAYGVYKATFRRRLKAEKEGVVVGDKIGNT